MKNTFSKKLLIAGGGTGGHVLAGVAIADLWTRDQTGEKNVLFVGAAGGIEEKLVPRAGYTLKTLNLGSLNQVSWKRKIKTFFQLPLSFLSSAYFLIKFKPDVVLGVGGYSSGPVVLIAKFLHRVGFLKTRVAILEQNAVPGITNRILGRFVDVVLAAFSSTETQFPGKRVVITGNPVRSVMKRMPPASRTPFTIFIFGGSQGAYGVNSLVLSSLNFLGDLKDRLCFVHQTGEKDFERCLEFHKKMGTKARVEKFIFDMSAVYAESSLLICRAGASTLAELSTVGRAAILIPLPTAADNHQEKNAKVFSDVGGAILLSQKNATGEDLACLIREFVTQPIKVDQMEKKVVDFCRPHAAEAVMKELLQIP